jgi:hypothetical protein
MTLFQSLRDFGSEFEAIWKSEKSRAFTECAHEYLSSLDLPSLNWSEITLEGVRQGNHSNFGDLNLHAYRGDDFCIEVLVWGTSSPDLHSHGFAGAFRVIEGGSVHAVHTAEVAAQSWPKIAIAEVKFEGVSILGVGDCLPIRSGPVFLHSLYHCSAPSVTVVLRTYTDSVHTDQYTFLGETNSTQVLISGRDHANDGVLKAIRYLKQSQPWQDVESALLERFADFPVWRQWCLYCEYYEHFTIKARETIAAKLPDELKSMSTSVRRQSLFENARPLLRSDKARTAAGLIMLAPCKSSLEECVEQAGGLTASSNWFEEAATSAFQDLFADDVEQNQLRACVRKALEGPCKQSNLSVEDRALSQIVNRELKHLV